MLLRLRLDSEIRTVVAASLFGVVDPNKMLNLIYEEDVSPEDIISSNIDTITGIYSDNGFLIVSMEEKDLIIPAFIAKELTEYLIDSHINHLELQEVVLRDRRTLGATLPLDKSSIEESYFVHEVILEVTRQCNLRCKHCLIPHHLKDPSSAGFMDVGLARKVIREARSKGASIVGITGGEPLLHPRLHEIVSFSREMLMGVMINTNLTVPIQGKLKEVLREMGSSVVVRGSVYGLTPEVMKSFTVTGGEREIATLKENLRFLREAGTDLVIAVFYTDIHKKAGVTLSDYDWLRDYGTVVFEKIEAGWGFVPPVRSLYVSEKRPTFSVNRYIEFLSSPTVGCPAQHIPSAYVTSEGMVYPCPFTPEVVAHAMGPDWLDIFVEKATFRPLPIRGGRCNLLFFDIDPKEKIKSY